MGKISNEQVLRVLKKYFGYDSLRGIQERAVRELIEGNDVLLTAPTGFGKSLCFQLPALVQYEQSAGRGSLAVIVCPLISLLHNQVSSLKNRGIQCALLSSSESAKDNDNVISLLKRGTQLPFSLLYVTAERLVTSSFLNLMDYLNKRSMLSFVAIDEAHCISEWGHDFRPAYSKLGVVKERFPCLPVIALTATATRRVQGDILSSLRIEGAKRVHKSFLRSNIFYQCRYVEGMKHSAEDDIVEYVLSRYEEAGGSFEHGIIYAFKTETVDILTEMLQKNGVPAIGYHGKKSGKARKEAQDLFESGKCPVAVASCAFGMGIDVSSVRYVIHHSLPKTLESFYQESGRAGRDGLLSDSILYYSSRDADFMSYLLTRGPEKDKKRQDATLAAFESMKSYCTTIKCRRVTLLAHFDESSSAEDVCREKWGRGCDVCKNKNDVRKRMRPPILHARRQPVGPNNKSPAAEFFSARTLFKQVSQHQSSELQSREISNDEEDILHFSSDEERECAAMSIALRHSASSKKDTLQALLAAEEREDELNNSRLKRPRHRIESLLGNGIPRTGFVKASDIARGNKRCKSGLGSKWGKSTR